MDETIRRFTSLDDRKRDEIRAVAAIAANRAIERAAELSIGAYRLKDRDDVPARLQETLIVFNSRNHAPV